MGGNHDLAAFLGIGAIALKAELSHRRFQSVKAHIEEVHLGESKADVGQHLGSPNNHSGACVDDFGPAKDCATEFIYSDPFEILMGNFYVIDFSRDGRVNAIKHIH